jgi:hypothetical protein
MMKIEMGKKYTSNGKEVHLLCVNGKDPLYPVRGICKNSFSNEEGVRAFTKFGKFVHGRNSRCDLVEVWQPQEGEWCWFWDTEEPVYSVLDRFKIMGPFDLFQSTNCSVWKHCAKFTGELPEHLKGL